MKRKVIIDTDPGQDDAMAILLALASQDDLDVLGVIAVAGNVPLSCTLSNARKILELAGRRDIPVFAGSECPLKRTLETAEHIHGVTGLDGPDLPDPTMPVQEIPGVQFLTETVRKHEPGEVTLITLGPATDVAKAFDAAPDIAGRLQNVVMMMGAWSEVGNITPTAEFNAYVDPDAADIVLRSEAKVVMVPLDVTHQVRSTPARLDRLACLNNRCGPASAAMLRFSQVYDLEKFGWDGAPLHDPCTVAYLLRPDIFKGKQVNVTVETQSPLTKGQTVVDWWHVTDRPRNVLFLREVDADVFYQLLTERLATLP